MNYVKIKFKNTAPGVYKCFCPIVDDLYSKALRVMPNPNDETVVYMAVNNEAIEYSENVEIISLFEFEDKAGRIKTKKDRRFLHAEYRNKYQTREQLKVHGLGEWEMDHADINKTEPLKVT